MIATIQIGGPNGPLVQGDMDLPSCDECPGWDVHHCDCRNYAAVRDGERVHTGRLVESYRRT
ncbi:hypothetical protein [Actibacterium sp. MT2.3-13A]|uniref:hypothetical protein n=1 Tax=Actibacterium sp. MT2.3-13A TaxID=2828332 RepID=UPI001BA8B3A0|nr:hypothetical protein [Actibacterium sp. MT2.3-13A]